MDELKLEDYIAPDAGDYVAPDAEDYIKTDEKKTDSALLDDHVLKSEKSSRRKDFYNKENPDLVPCDICGKLIYVKANQCPYCGRVYRPKVEKRSTEQSEHNNSHSGRGIIAFILFIIAFLLLFGLPTCHGIIQIYPIK